MDAFEKYSEIFINQAIKLFDEENLATNPEYHEVYRNHLLGLDGPKSMERRQTPSLHFFSKLSKGFFEIFDTYYSLLDIVVYIGRFPYNNTGVSKTRHLAYHMENYLNEVYILKERLVTYLKTIERGYRKDLRYQKIIIQTKSLALSVKEIFKALVGIRGSHVHETRFSDEDLDRLKSLELLANHGGEDLQIIKVIFKDDYNSTRKKYKQTIKNNNERIKELLDIYFEVIYEIVADDEGEIRYPRASNSH